MQNSSDEQSVGLSSIANAARTNVALFDLSDRTQIEITGADRVRFLHGLTSNDIKRLKPGFGCETFVTNLKGKIVAHVFVFCTDHSLWLDGTPGQQDAIIKHLGKYVLIDDVQLIPRTGDRGELFVTGPMAAALLQWEDGLPVGCHVTREAAGESFDIRRVDLLGQPGFLMSIPHSRLDVVKQGLTLVGVGEGSREFFESLRIDAGYPRYGVDISDENLAQEAARTKQCISFDKGCYLGQETVARLDSLGHTNQELRRLQFDAPDIPAAGSPVFDSTGATQVGIVTSAALDPYVAIAEQKASVVAMGLLKRSALSAETAICLVVDHQQVPGRTR